MTINFLGFNWKLNPETYQESIKLYQEYISLFSKSKIDVVFFPPSPLLSEFSKNTDPESKLKIGSQTISSHTTGAFTSDISSSLLKTMGLKYALIGHSEVRKHTHLSEKDIALELENSLENSVLCIGYVKDVNNSKKTTDLIDLENLKEQVETGLKHNKNSKLIIAYEPVWAIGTGKTASFEDVQKVTTFIKNLVSSYKPDFKVSILYGGSVSSSNIKELSQVKDLDGFLIGGSSLKISELQFFAKNFTD